jgi:hypothetical protein
MGANMVKWTNKMLRYTKIIIPLVKGLNIVAKCCLNWISFHDDLCCCIGCSNVANHVEIIKSNAQKQSVEFAFGRRFHDLNYIEVEFIF